MIFPGMWKGVVFGFSILTIIAILFFTVFLKIMPNENDPGEELTPDEM